ncbi:F-box protein [Carex littledalei]|uniref:F-box protein n=1 Tax=Carex littledalei TaxID=544730 RepID=A0A833VDY2_9POAL|nr:F-box protein [Carex littledalei]
MSVNNMSHRIPDSWASLPPDLLLSIANSLDVTTFIRLSAVCISWASTIRPCLPSFPPFRRDQPIPWLLCSAQKSDTGPNHSDLTFYDLITAVYYSVQIPVPSFCDHQWLGSYKGWLVTLDKQLQLHLIKPLTGAHVLLPSKGIENEHPKKVVLCHHPDNPNELQAFCLTQQGCLVSTKLGDESWTRMNCKHFFLPNTTYEDIAIYEGKLYAVSRDVLSCWNHRSSSAQHLIAYSDHYFGWTRYLLEWNSELVMLMINKNEMVSFENHTPKPVKLYKLKLTYYVCSYSRVRSLKNDALFFGADCSYAVSSSGHDDIQRNCIYFTNQVSRCSQSHENHNFGVFDYGKRTYTPCCPQDSPMHLTSPIWFWPC